jgi:NADPH2:quinone reductase
MRAVILREFGSIEGLELTDVAEPEASAGEVVVDIRAQAVNFVDLLVIAGAYQFLPERPFSPGKLPVGSISAVGPDVSGFEIGDRVLTLAEHGGYAERLAVAASSCFTLPEQLSFVGAATMSLAYDTAWFALRERARLAAGETVLVLGATGSVGIATMQLAKAFGARVLAGVSSLASSDRAYAAGADGVIDLSVPDLREDLRAQVHRQTAGAGVDVVIDMLGGDYFSAALRALAWRGRLVVVGFAAGDIPSIKVNYLLLKNIEVSGLQISDYRKRTPDLMATCIREIFDLYRAGRLHPPDAQVYPLDDYAAALHDLQERKTRGRVVLTPRASPA